MARLLVASDIFGQTTDLAEQIEQLAKITAMIDVWLVSPESANRLAFSNESTAYQTFVESGGMKRYQWVLDKHIAEFKPTAVLGFSAGASALWACCTAPPFALAKHAAHPTIKHTLLCYGGQIRQMVEHTPLTPLHCLWSRETQFDIEALMLALQHKPLLSQQLWPYQHGFVNPASLHYDVEGATRFWQFTQQYFSPEQPH